MWKLLTEIIADEIYIFYDDNGILLVEQNDCQPNCCGIKDQLLIYKMVMEDSKRKKTNLARTLRD